MQPFEMKFTIAAHQADSRGRAKPSALLYLCQEAAGGHCGQLGVDWQTLQARGLFWALIRTNVQVEKLPVTGQQVTVRTWPMPTTRTAFPRAVVCLDEDGNTLFSATSLWVLMDTQNRRMLLPGKSGVELEGITLGCELPPPASIHPVALQQQTYRTVAKEDLDRNAHMNNTRYMDWLFDLLPADAPPIKGFTACYLNEATNGQNLRLSWQDIQENLLQLEIDRTKDGQPEQTERVFAARVEF